MKVGSKAHRNLFCRTFVQTHIEFEPETLPWPDLTDDQLDLLRGVPFWEVARDTEREAGVLVAAMADTIDDPVIRDAIALQGAEEARHANLVQTLIDRYSIEVKPAKEIELPENVEQRFTDFGFEECLESYFAFGLFKIVRDTDTFPEELSDIFDPILQEEARHITFFINWFCYNQVQRGMVWGLPPVRATRASWHYGRAVRGLVRSIRSGDGNGFAFTATGAKSFDLDLTPKQFLAICKEENAKRMANLDRRLLRPSLVPNLALTAHTVLRAFPERTKKAAPAANESEAAETVAV